MVRSPHLPSFQSRECGGRYVLLTPDTLQGTFKE
jgi:hypothetical protein